MPGALLAGFLLLSLVPAQGDVERYKSEAAYLARLAELGYETVVEGFEGSDWDAYRSNSGTSNWAVEVTTQGITWDSAAQELWGGPTALITTNTNWAHTSTWGLFDNYLPSSIRVTTDTSIHGIGFWINTNPDLDDVGVLFPDRVVANSPGYVLAGFGAMYPGDIAPVGHEFIGFVDPAGFTEVIITGVLQINEESQLEGQVVYGVDDFTFGVPVGFLGSPLEIWRGENFSPADLGDPSKEGSVWGATADPDGDGLINDGEFALATDPNDRADGNGGVVISVDESMGEPLLVLTYYRRNDEPTLIVTPRFSEDLQTWSGGAGVFEVLSAVDEGNGYDLVTARLLAGPTPRRKGYARMAVSRTGG